MSGDREQQVYRRKISFDLSELTTIDEACARLSRDLGRALGRGEALRHLAQFYLDHPKPSGPALRRIVPLSPAAPEGHLSPRG
jgi:hypothetical protein